MIEEKLRQLIKESVDTLGYSAEIIHLEHPADLRHGDFSTNVAMVLAKEVKMNPKELAEKIVEVLEKDDNDFVKKVEVAGSGFINFFLTQDFFTESLEEILKRQETYGSNETFKGKKVIIEYTDPNPFKQFHIGHLMSNSIGEALSRIFEFHGAEVKRANYQGDVGLHVAKAIWGMIKTKKKMPSEGDELSLKAEYLGNAYAQGASSYEDNGEAKDEIKEINKHIYDEDSQEINNLYETGRNWSLEYFEMIYRRLGTQFDYYFFESITGGIGRRIVEENLNTVFKDSKGATVFLGEEYGLHTRVFINSEGQPTYEAKELGLAVLKSEKYPYDFSFVVTGNEIAEYFKVIMKALGQIYPELEARTKHVPHGMLRLKSGKMSSRTGEVITAVSLLDEAEGKVREVMKGGDLSKEEKDLVADQIAVGAVKYSILRQSAGKDIIFDFEAALSFEGNSGPYLQYTYARAQSILKKAGNTKPSATWESDSQVQAEDVLRLLYRFPEVVKKAGEEYEPHHIATFLFELAHTFNNYYAHEKILDDSDAVPYKLAVVEAVAITIKNGLNLLGIQAPSKM